MTELENKVCEVLDKIQLPLCACEIGTCEGNHPGKSCKMWITRQILLALTPTLPKDEK
jgi:hypothetical protein